MYYNFVEPNGRVDFDIVDNYSYSSIDGGKTWQPVKNGYINTEVFFNGKYAGSFIDANLAGNNIDKKQPYEITFTDAAWYITSTFIPTAIFDAAEHAGNIKYSYASSRPAREAYATKVFSVAGNYGKWAGRLLIGLDVGVDIANATINWDTEKRGYYNAKIIGSALITGVSFIPFIGPIASFGLAIADSSGAFDGIYTSMADYVDFKHNP